MDTALGISEPHRMTKSFQETLAFLGQAAASFEDAREILSKLFGIGASATLIQRVTEEIGAAVFASDRLATDIVASCPLKENTAKKTANLLGYLENNRDRARYDRFEEAGYYVGSGMIECGNKVVIQKRLKQCGMRWSVSGGQFVASLRAKKQSGKCDIVQHIIFSKEAA